MTNIRSDPVFCIFVFVCGVCLVFVLWPRECVVCACVCVFIYEVCVGHNQAHLFAKIAWVYGLDCNLQFWQLYLSGSHILVTLFKCLFSNFIATFNASLFNRTEGN